MYHCRFILLLVFSLSCIVPAQASVGIDLVKTCTFAVADADKGGPEDKSNGKEKEGEEEEEEEEDPDCE